MARVEADGGQLTVHLTEAEEREICAESGRLTVAHYRDGATREYCDRQWAALMIRLLGAKGWSEVRDRDGVRRSSMARSGPRAGRQV